MIQSVTQLIAEKLELNKWTSHLLVKPMGYDVLTNKFTIRIESEALVKSFIVKVSPSYDLNDLIRVEAENIDSLIKLSIEGIPSIIVHGLVDGRYVIAQEFINGRKPHSSAGTFDQTYGISMPWLKTLVTKTSGQKIGARALLKKTEGFIEAVSEFFPIAETIPLMEKFAPSIEIPSSWAHGDFWHGNMIIDANAKLWLTDFAFSAPDEPPIDVLDIIYDYEPQIFLARERLEKYTIPFIPKEINPLFLVLYMLSRKLALKVNEKRRIFNELLVLNLSRELANIGEAGVLQNLIRALRSNS